MSTTTHREATATNGSANQAPPLNGQPTYARQSNGGPHSQAHHNHQYLPAIDPNLAAIAQSFTNMTLPGSTMNPHAWAPNGQYYYPSSFAHSASGHENMLQGYGTYLGQPGYPNVYPQLLGSPMPPSWPSSRMTSGSELPNLMSSRRDSGSSNEHDIPATPYTQYHGYTNGVTVMDHSPHTLGYPWSTPSTGRSAYSVSKVVRPSVVSQETLDLVNRAPAIPPAVPAPCTPPKPLDRSLENPKGVTNVYIRGLQPDTTDDKLFEYGARFGEIDTSKAIIDFETGTCKGYGFIKYHSFKDAELCIRGFHCLGYETSFARESFYVQLKKLSDEKNTNLYVSNLPKDMNEAELAATFHPFKCCSSRILRDSMGNGRGVGFARFDDRRTCEQVIKQYYNALVESKDGVEKYQIQIRFADTQDQKSLKQTTAAARQYRSAEYESQTRHIQGDSPSSAANEGLPTTGDFETYMKRATGGVLRSHRNVSTYPNGDALERERPSQTSVHFSPKTATKAPYSVSNKVSVSHANTKEGVSLNYEANKEAKVTSSTGQQYMSATVADSTSETA